MVGWVYALNVIIQLRILSFVPLFIACGAGFHNNALLWLAITNDVKGVRTISISYTVLLSSKYFTFTPIILADFFIVFTD